MSSRVRTAIICSAFLVLASSAYLIGTSAAELKQADNSAIIGLWGSEQNFGPLVWGELTIDARGSIWRARVSGFETSIGRNKDFLTFLLPGGSGEFRGHLSSNGKTILGHWIQPAGPASYSSLRASPVELTQVGPQVWRGSILPLKEKTAFYVSIQRLPDGSLTAMLRDPVTNFFHGHPYNVELKDGSVTLSYGEQRLEGTFDRAADLLTLSLIDPGPPVLLRRRKDGNAIGFYPRVPSGDSYVYQKPVAESDGWSTASLADVGLDAKPIYKLVEKILAATPSLDNPVNIQGLLIARHGKLVLEEYFYGFDKERPHDMRSASKTFAPLLVGIAREHGARIGLDTPVHSFFTEYTPFANPDERKDKITVRDLMTMTSGRACRGQYDEDSMQEQTKQPDWYKFALDVPMEQDPGGENAVYCSADINLLGGIVKNATGKWLPEFFDTFVARPMQMRSYQMNLMPTGEGYLGGGLYIRPRDALKLGQLYLDGGVWKGHRIISLEWVKDSVSYHSGFKPVFDLDVDHNYGYGWHLRDHKAGGRVFHDYYAGGNGGQLTIVIPELDMVVQFTGGDYAEARKFFRWEIELTPQYIIPAALSGSNNGTSGGKASPSK
jgi:CubicO group peptidase (beta-lactamase class C family)